MSGNFEQCLRHSRRMKSSQRIIFDKIRLTGTIGRPMSRNSGSARSITLNPSLCPSTYTVDISFCRANLCISTAYAAMRCLSVRSSQSCILSKWINISSKFYSPSGSHTILVFPCQMLWQYSDGNPPNGGLECRWGMQKIVFLNQYLAFVSMTGGTWSSIHDWRCSSRSHSACPFTAQTVTNQWVLFITASMDDYAKEYRVQFNCMYW